MASDIVWTNHLEERLAQRGISRNEAFETIRHPDKNIRLSQSKFKLIKTFSHKQVTVVAVYEAGKYIILTSWSRIPGQKNTYWQNKKDPLLTRLVQSLLVKFVNSITALFHHHRKS